MLISIDYGDVNRPPLPYIATDTSEVPFVGFLPKEIALQPQFSYDHFPKLSETILIELFSSIGVEYVPEITLFIVKKRRSIDVFREFVETFGISLQNRLEGSLCIDANILNHVISSLKRMDSFRQEYPFDNRLIYRSLARQEMVEVERLMSRLEEMNLLLGELCVRHENDALLVEELKREFIANWHKDRVIKKIIKRIKND